GEDEAEILARRKSADRHLGAEVGVLGRQLDRLAVRRELPAVIAAANVVALDPAVGERRAAVRAEILHEVRLARGSAIERVLLAGELDALRATLLELGRDVDRLPEGLEVAVDQRARPDMGEILFRTQLSHQLPPSMSLSPRARGRGGANSI